MRRIVSIGLVVYVCLLAFSLAYLIPKLHRARHEGWHGGTTVTSAEPATGLRVGDRLLAFNGDTRIDRAGAAVFLFHYPTGKPYRLRVRRGDEVLERTLAIEERPGWAVAQYSAIIAVGTLCCLMSTWICWKDPKSRMVRITWAAGMLAALQMLAFGLMAGQAGGWAPATVAYALFWVGPWKLYATYAFAAALPTGAPETGRWRILEKALVALVCVLAIETAPHDLADLSLPGEAGIRLALLAARLTPRPPLWSLSLAIFAVAIVAAVWRNYRRLESEDGRRRVRWVVFGLVVSSVCAATGEALVLLGLAGPVVGSAGQLSLALIPLTLGYAIMRHRVLGVSVVVRQGLQYLLARHFLAAIALAVPATAAVRGWLHPEWTLRQLIDPPWLYGGVLGLSCAALAARPWLIAALDRRFFREAWDRERVLAGLLERIRTQQSFAETAETARQTIADALHPEAVEVFYRPRRAGRLESPAGERLDEGDRDSQEWREQRGFEVALPARSKDGVAGILLLGPKRSEEPYTGRDLEWLRLIADHLGLAHENWLLAMERAEAVVTERTRIARELHDTLAQGFAGISLHLESARLALGDGPEDAGRHLEQARSLARSSLAEARRSVHDLREAAARPDLARRLRELAAQLSAGTPVEVRVETRGSAALPDAVGANLFRIAQESVTNALKHSGATRIEIEVEYGAGGVRLRVRDNGRGFDPSAGSGGYGLAGMRERAAEMHGEVEVRNSEGGGTEVCAFAQLA